MFPRYAKQAYRCACQQQTKLGFYEEITEISNRTNET